MKRLFFLAGLLFWLPACLMGQDSLLSLDKAIGMALKNNYAIQIARTDLGIAKNNDSWGTAGALPALSANASLNGSKNSQETEYADGLTESADNAVTSVDGASVNLDWTLFDGMRMFVSKQKLEEYTGMGELALRREMENTIAGIILAYSKAVSLKLLLRESEGLLALAAERMRIAEGKFKAGVSPKQEYLQAVVDHNAEKAGLIRQREAWKRSLVELNRLMAEDVAKSWTVADTLLIGYRPLLSELRSSVTAKNVTLLMARKNMDIAGLSIKEVNALRYPRLGFSSSYAFLRSSYNTGTINTSSKLGLNYGLTLSIPIYDGHTISTQVKNARLDADAASMENKDLEQQVQADLLDAWNSHEANIGLLELEQQNIRIAKENLNLSMGNYKSGQTSSLELMNAQQSYSDAVARLLTALLAAKTTEVALMKLNGELIK